MGQLFLYTSFEIRCLKDSFLDHVHVRLAEWGAKRREGKKKKKRGKIDDTCNGTAVWCITPTDGYTVSWYSGRQIASSPFAICDEMRALDVNTFVIYC
jgi:predicted metal-binding transcription factor (methanogenesis marker protein 9)